MDNSIKKYLPKNTDISVESMLIIMLDQKIELILKRLDWMEKDIAKITNKLEK